MAYGENYDIPGTFTPRTPRKGWPGDQIDAFAHMQQLGADFIEAAMACLTGHRMTPDLAAMCIASYWRRYTAVANFQESRGAAITLQAVLRGMDARVVARDRMSAQRNLQAALHGRQHYAEDIYSPQYQAAMRLQAVWRGHLARVFTDKLKWQSKSKLQRTFSWGKKGKSKKAGEKKRDGIKERSAKDILDSAGVENNKPKNSVRRSMSFDRFSKGVKSIMHDGKNDAPAPATPAKSKQLLFILLQRGNTGLGLELDATNTVVNLVPGGAADTQGYFREGDTIASVDGIPLRGRLLQDVMDRQKNSYSFDVWRLTPVEPEPVAPKAVNPVRRAFSFDRKKNR